MEREPPSVIGMVELNKEPNTDRENTPTQSAALAYEIRHTAEDDGDRESLPDKKGRCTLRRVLACGARLNDGIKTVNLHAFYM